MEQNEIIEGNKLIAHFMESITGEELGGYTEKGWASACKYHTSWNWIMPVVETIAALREEGKYKRSQIPDGSKADWIFCLYLLAADINTAWVAVVEFIKWYNQQKELTNGKE